jgi:hypothetical protein
MPSRERRDLARALLAAGVLTLGAGRPDWGRAMMAELGQLEGLRTRWVFALGCVRSIAFTMPPAGLQRVVAGGSVLAAACSAGVVAVALVRYPDLVSGARAWVSVAAFIALLVTYVVAAATFAPRVDGRRLLLNVAVAGAAIAASWMAVGLVASLGGPKPVSVMLLSLAPLVAVAIGWHATASSGSSRVGLACVGLAAVIAGYALFLLWAGEAVAAAGRPYDAGLLRDFRTSGASDLATYAVSDSLGTGMMLLLMVPLVTLAGGLVGAAAAGTTKTRPSSGEAANPGEL